MRTSIVMELINVVNDDSRTTKLIESKESNIFESWKIVETDTSDGVLSIKDTTKIPQKMARFKRKNNLHQNGKMKLILSSTSLGM